jgi:hypothetical protein
MMMSENAIQQLGNGNNRINEARNYVNDQTILWVRRKDKIKDLWQQGEHGSAIWKGLKTV